MEIVNKEVQKFLQIYRLEKQDQWANWLAIAQFLINSKKHTSTKVAPFKATWSYVLQMEIEPIPVNKAPAAKDFTSKMEGMLESMRKNLEKAKEQMKLNTDKYHSAVPTYKIGPFQLLAIVIWIDRHISHAGLTLCTNVSSGISSFVIFLCFLLEEFPWTGHYTYYSP